MTTRRGLELIQVLDKIDKSIIKFTTLLQTPGAEINLPLYFVDILMQQQRLNSLIISELTRQHE